jgi:hypothetical protein
MKVIDQKQLPMRSPIIAGIVFWLALDHWSAPGWAYGAVGTFWALLFIIWIVRQCTEETARVDL